MLSVVNRQVERREKRNRDRADSDYGECSKFAHPDEYRIRRGSYQTYGCWRGIFVSGPSSRSIVKLKPKLFRLAPGMVARMQSSGSCAEHPMSHPSHIVFDVSSSSRTKSRNFRVGMFVHLSLVRDRFDFGRLRSGFLRRHRERSP